MNYYMNARKISIILILFFLLNFLSLATLASPTQDDPVFLEPAIIVSDQAIINDSVSISKVISSGLGWLVIHADSNGNPGTILGKTQVHHGINVGIEVILDSSGRTDVLHTMLHIDNGTLGVYNGVEDIPVRDSSNAVVTVPFNVLNSEDPFVLVNDQPIIDNKVVILLINIDVPGWIVIHIDESGSPSTTIGETYVPAGSSRNVIVEIESNSVTEILYAMLHEDGGNIGIYDGLPTEPTVFRNGNIVSPSFEVSAVEFKSVEPVSNALSSQDLHILLSILSGLILIGVAILNISRNRVVRLNQIFFVFFVSIALYQIFDAILVFSNVESDLFILNLIRDISVTFLILGLLAGAISGLMIQYGEDLFFEKRNILILLATFAVLLFLSLFGDIITIETDSVDLYGSTGAHIEFSRAPIGWIGITGSFILFSGIIIYSLATLLPKVDSDLTSRILRLLFGFILAISLLFLFDIAFSFEFIRQGFLGDSIIHFLMHEIIVLGVLFVLSAFWTPVKQAPKD